MSSTKTSVVSAVSTIPSEATHEYARIGWMEHSITSVLRWLGANGITVKQAKLACRALEIPVADATVQAQVYAGKKGERGEPAELTKAQQAIWRKAAAAAAKESKPAKAVKSAKPAAKKSSKSKPAAVPAGVSDEGFDSESAE